MARYWYVLSSGSCEWVVSTSFVYGCLTGTVWYSTEIGSRRVALLYSGVPLLDLLFAVEYSTDHYGGDVGIISDFVTADQCET